MAFSELEGSHSGKNLADELYNIVKKHEIELGNLTGDNLSTNNKGVRLLARKLKADDLNIDFNKVKNCSNYYHFICGAS